LFAGENSITEYNAIGAHLIKLVYRRLLTITFTTSLAWPDPIFVIAFSISTAEALILKSDNATAQKLGVATRDSSGENKRLHGKVAVL